MAKTNPQDSAPGTERRNRRRKPNRLGVYTQMQKRAVGFISLLRASQVFCLERFNFAFASNTFFGLFQSKPALFGSFFRRLRAVFNGLGRIVWRSVWRSIRRNIQRRKHSSRATPTEATIGGAPMPESLNLPAVWVEVLFLGRAFLVLFSTVRII